MSRILGLIDVDTCHICGQDAHPKFLMPWNGVTACVYCVRDIHNEIDTYEEAEQHERNTYFSIGNTGGTFTGIWGDGEAVEQPGGYERTSAESGSSSAYDSDSSANTGPVRGDCAGSSFLDAGSDGHSRVAATLFAIPGGRASSNRCAVLAAYAGSGSLR